MPRKERNVEEGENSWRLGHWPSEIKPTDAGWGGKENQDRRKQLWGIDAWGRASSWAVSRSAGNLVSQLRVAVGNLGEVEHRVKKGEEI